MRGVCVNQSRAYVCVRIRRDARKTFPSRVLLPSRSPGDCLSPLLTSLQPTPSSPTTHTHVAPAMCVFLSFYGLLTTTSGSESGSCSGSGTGSVSQGNEYINTLPHTHADWATCRPQQTMSYVCVCVCGKGGPCRPVVSTQREREGEAGTGRVCP